MKSRWVAAAVFAASMLVGICSAGRCQTPDEFNKPTLDPIWTVGPLSPGSSIDLTSRPGFLHLVSSDLDSPRLLQPVSGTWSLDVLVDFAASDDFESAGIVIGNERVAEIAYDASLGGRVVRCLGGFEAYAGSTVLLRITQYPGLLVGFWMGDDGLWHEDTSGDRNENVSSIGLFAARQVRDGQTRPASAYFDYFRIGPFTPVPVRATTWARVKALFR